MIVVDTSVWIASLRGIEPQSKILKSFLDADEVALPVPVRIELLARISRGERARVERALTGLPICAITDGTWAIVRGWVGPAADVGHTFTISDLLIGAVASEIGGLVWSLDRDFERMAALGFVRLYHQLDSSISVRDDGMID